MVIDRVTIFCFGASYAVALFLEVLERLRPQSIWRWLKLVAGGAGLFAHTLYLYFHALDVPGGTNTLLALSWIVAIFYLYGVLHYPRSAWGLFVAPLVTGLVLLAAVGKSTATAPALSELSWQEGQRLWIVLHVGLLVLAAVGLSVSFVASVMYLVQASRLRRKVPPDRGVPIFNLERLERMSRRGVLWAFPMLTAGLIIGLGMLLQTGVQDWLDPKILTAGLLWLVYGVVLYLRYGAHVRGRRLAWWSVIGFACLLLAYMVHIFLPSSHPFGEVP